jgi:acyl-coenzyme A synthetase/AMP-(fatty) acid ligase
MGSELIKLESLLTAGRSGDQPVAFAPDGVRTWADFVAQVGSLSARLDAANAGRWLIYFEDAYAFAVSLLAVAHSGGVAVLPPNGQAGTLGRLGDFVDGFLLNDPNLAGAASGVVIGDPLAPALTPPVSLGDLDPQAPFIEFFTSGTSGGSKRVAKRLRHLDDELAVLEGLFGASIGAARVVATVSHQHIYGALFRVLWPLAAGRPFSARTYLHGNEVVARMAEVRSVLVSSPVQLKAMAESGVLHGTSPAAIFSSGGPLDGQTAAQVAGMTGTAVAEIFGSTETGGVAWRQRPLGGEVPWQPFPGVAVTADRSGRLCVCSSLVSVGDEVGGGRCRFVMGDRVEMDAAGGFSLRGRADRIVKVGSKRLSLPEMEAELGKHLFVDEAALVLMRRGIESRVGAAVVLSDSGRRRLGEVGRAELGRELSAVLAPFYDRVLLPRAWRFVERLPRTAQGKLPEAEVGALFAADGSGAAPLEPIVESEICDDDSLRQSCIVPDDLAFFSGHFDSFPVVPGVAQLRWVLAAAQTLLGACPRVRAIEALKFRQPLRPGARFELELRADGDRNCIRFRLWREDGEISAGRIVLA